MGGVLSEMTMEELRALFPIILKEHNPEYINWYQIEEACIMNGIGTKQIKRISHIGSSSVEGLIAKPTVDILLEIDNHCDLLWLKKELKYLGWILMAEKEEPHLRMSFNKGYTPHGFAEKVYHLHVQYYGDWDELYFRDYLKEHPQVCREYEKLKLSLFQSFEYDRDGYTEAKTGFVRKYSELARQCYPGRYLPR